MKELELEYESCQHSTKSQALKYTLLFFQFEMHGGIFHSFCSFAVTFLVGECNTGAGGEGGPRGILVLIL